MNQQSRIQASGNEVLIYSIDTGDGQLRTLIEQVLPDQGCIEVQRDVPGKEHSWHQHDTDETLVIIDGSVNFYWEGNEKVCSAGSVISLPSGVRHGSTALEDGATYLIAFQNAKLTHHV